MAAQAVAVAVGTAVAVPDSMAAPAIAMVVVAVVAVSDRLAAASDPAAISVRLALRVAAEESSLLMARVLMARALDLRRHLGTNPMDEIRMPHVMRTGARVGPSGHVATLEGLSVIKRST